MELQLVEECLGFRTLIAMMAMSVLVALRNHLTMGGAALCVWRGAILAYAANMVRIQVLFFVSKWWPSAFAICHDYLGYATMLAATMLLAIEMENAQCNQSDK